MDGENFTMDDVDPETTCSICYAEFLDPDDLRVHVAQVHLTDGSKERYCQFCASIFSNLESYALHIRDVHIASIKCCKYCTKAFIDPIALRKHELKHYVYVKKNTYSCSQCKDLFSNLLELEEHELKEHDNKLDGIMLHGCYSILSSILNIKAPNFLQSLGKSAVFLCNKCDFTSPDVPSYIKHLQTLNCRSMVCDKCSKVYKDKKGIQKHLVQNLECHNFVQKKHLTKACHLCLREVKALQLEQHLGICKPVKCNVCNIVFTSICQLSEHQTKEHPMAITLTTCHFCRREFVGSVALEKHINRSHAVDFHLYKYTCIYCEGAFFKHPKDLFAHLFSKHQQVEPYCCKICNKLFRVRKRFTLHIKLDHKSVGFVEFDERYHVFFTDKKSEKPFQPISFFDKTDNGNDKDGTDGALAKIKEIEETDAENMGQTEKETDAEQIEQTDKETDTEAIKQKASESKKKLPKIRFKEQAKADLNLINKNSDFISATETEGNLTENDSKSLLTRMKRKRKAKPKPKMQSKKLKKSVISETENDISDDEPLLKVKHRQKMKLLKLKSQWNNKKRLLQISKRKKKQFTCKICNKYCYTYQNYNHHRSLHTNNEAKRCIKCSMEFRTESELNEHVSTEHASSRLTDTLKSLLERRKRGGKIPQPQLSMAERFQKTIKKAKSDNIPAKVTLTEMSEKLSVQTFIENFTPDPESKKNSIDVSNVVSIKTLKHLIHRPLRIKITKFNPEPKNLDANTGPVKLAMPVRFKHSLGERHKVNIKLVQKPINIMKTPIHTTKVNNTSTEEHYEDNDYQEETFDDYEDQTDQDKDDDVPDMAHEVMLGDTEDPKPTVIPHKIVIPKLPKEYKQIRIAHLLPQAPFYKIVKVDDVLKQPIKRGIPEDVVKLPSGTKLVNVNPLAHLLDNKSVEKVVNSTRSKYYKPKKNNFEKAIAKALLKLENTEASSSPKKKSGKKSLEVENEQ